MARFSTPRPEELKNEMDFELRESGLHADAYQKLLDRLRDLRVDTQSPYFMNQLFSGVRSEVLEIEKLISESRTTMATFEASGPFTLIEMETVRALARQIGWESAYDGVVVPGGSAANFMAIHMARQLADEGFKTRGNRPHWKIFSTREAHYSLEKAVLALGLGLDSLVSVKTDARGRMRPESLRRAISDVNAEGHEPLMVNTTLGTTVLGAFDPIDEIIEASQGTPVHVDGAWGGPAIFSPRMREMVKGLEKAASFTFDAHKLFGADLTCSVILTRHEGLLLEANDVHGGEYLFHESSGDEDEQGLGRLYDRGRLSWQCGRRPEIVSLWGLWKKHGTTGLGDIVEEKLKIRDEVVSWIGSQPGLKLLHEPEYLNICVQVQKPVRASGGEATGKVDSYEDDPDWSRHVRQVLKRENKALVNFSTREDGLTFLRLILAHHQLKTDHVTKILQWALDV